MLVQNTTKLSLVKTAHTIIWAFFVAVIGFVVYAGTTGEISRSVWVAMGLVAFEGVLLMLNRGKCPLTAVARRYSSRQEENFDIFLPEWLARSNKVIFTVIFFIGVGLVLYRVIQ